MREQESTAAAEPHSPLDVAALYAQHAVFVGRIIKRLASPGPHVEDLLQETFIVAFKQRASFQGRSSVETWLYGIAENLCWRYRRGLSRFNVFHGRMSSHDDHEQPRLPSDELEKKEAIAAVQRALAKLSFKQREVFVLYELEGREGDEIASMIGIPAGTVWTRLHQARKSFKKVMERERARGQL